MATSSTDTQVVVQRLMQSLRDNLSTKSLSDNKCSEILGQLKLYGRDPREAGAIYSKPGIETLCKYAYGDYDPSVYREAMRCIANALLLQQQWRSFLVTSGYDTSTAKIYQRQNNDDEFLGARILFLVSYEANADLATLLASHDLAHTMNEHLTRHSSARSGGTKATDQMEQMALSETLKLIFNLANYCPSDVDSLSTAVPAICTILLNTDDSPLPLEPPLSLIVNALAILDFRTLSTPAATDAAQKQYVALAPKVAHILDRAIAKYTPVELETQAIPLMTVLRKLYDIGSANVRSLMQQLLLPNDSERDLPLGQSSTLASRLLRLTTSPGLTNLSEAISAFLFQMSDENASTFIRNIGYGYAAGYLMTHNIPIPDGMKQSKNSDTRDGAPINPVTGQRLDKEAVPDLPEMTQEEKEREAERLFVLFERLKATGVVDVKNPVQQAMEEGRFEEVDSDPD